MTIGLYWWSPTATLRSAGVQLNKYWRAWASVCQSTRSYPSNFGDAVNPIIVRELTGLTVRRASIKKADLVCIGSVISEYSRAGSEAVIFGSGMRGPSLPGGGAIDRTKVVAVRGCLSARALDVEERKAVGDPGLVIRAIVGQKASHGRHQRVLLPHFTEFNSVSGREQLDAARKAGFKVLMPNLPPLAIAQELRFADCVYTSSLHGLIFADALGVPAQLVSLTGGQPSDGRFKYDDYMSIFGMDADIQPVDFTGSHDNEGMLRDRMEHRSSSVASKIDDVVAGIFQAASSLA